MSIWFIVNCVHHTVIKINESFENHEVHLFKHSWWVGLMLDISIIIFLFLINLSLLQSDPNYIPFFTEMKRRRECLYLWTELLRIILKGSMLRIKFLSALYISNDTIMLFRDQTKLIKTGLSPIRLICQSNFSGGSGEKSVSRVSRLVNSDI